MQKRTVILYMVFSFLSLVIIFLMYKGYIRFWKCKYRKCTAFAEPYLTLPRADSDSRVIISLSTKSKDFKHIEPTIASLLDQTVHPDQIILNLFEGKNDTMAIPSFLKDNKIITVFSVSPEYEESASFLSPLLREKDANTKIILLDDKQVYGVDLIETLVDASVQNPKKAIYIHGYKASSYLKDDNQKLDQGLKNDIIEITQGVLIKPTFLNADVLDISKTPVHARDVVLSANLAKNNVSLHQVIYKDNFVSEGKTDAETDKKAILFYAADLAME